MTNGAFVKHGVAMLVAAGLLLTATPVFAQTAGDQSGGSSGQATAQQAGQPNQDQQNQDQQNAGNDAGNDAGATMPSSPEQPMAYSGSQWHDLQPGQWDWYAFKYSYDTTESDSGSPRQSNALVTFFTNPGSGAMLLLVSREQMQAWQRGNKLEWFGAATPAQLTSSRVNESLRTFCAGNPDDPACDGSGDVGNSRCENLANNPTGSNCSYKRINTEGYSTWSGRPGASGAYYIVVRRDSRVTGPVSYRFNIEGEGLTMK